MTFSSGTPRRCAAASMMRALAWWATKTSMSSMPMPARCERDLGRLDHPRDGVAVDLAALHPQQPLLHVDVEQVGVAAVGAQLERRDPVLDLVRRDDDRAGSVGEEDRGAAVGVVGDAAQRFGAADDDEVRAVRLDERRRLVERVEEARARGVEVDRAGEVAADLLGDRGREARHHAIRGEAADHDAVDVLRFAAGVLEGHRAGLGGEVGERARAVEQAALADAGAPDDPLIRRVEVLREIGVRDDLLGQRGSDADDAGLHAAARRVRLTRPRRTAPGPHST